MSTCSFPGVGGLTERKAFKLIGFKALLGWHYLILFTPLLIEVYEADTYAFFFQRQLVLYTIFALSFVILIAVDRWLLRKTSWKPSIALLIGIGIASVGSTVWCIISLASIDVAMRLAATVALGMSQAFLMHFWLRYYQILTDDRRYRTLSVDVIGGAAIAFFVCVLQPPYSYIVIIALPLVSAISLIVNLQTTEFPGPPKTEDASAVGKTLQKSGLLSHFMRAVLPTIVFAFVFGMLQGSYIGNGFALMMAIDPLILLGIGVCGIVLMSIPEDSQGHKDIDTIHRASMLLFIVGIVGLFFGRSFLVLSEAAILAGFNLFDFGAMALGISIIRKLDLKSSVFINGGRALTYFGLAVGLLVGYLVMAYVQEDTQVLLYSMSGLAIVLLMTTTIMIPFKRLREADALVDFELSPRDQDAGQGVAAWLPPRPVPGGVGEGGGYLEAAMPKTVQEIDSPRILKEQIVMSAADQPDNQTPWKRSCQEVASLYRLTPRETEIFFLIAKGRNAEYIQQFLYISTHTAKTHIANIYHKLGVHSSQEMLSLVELFRKQHVGGDGGKECLDDQVT